MKTTNIFLVALTALLAVSMYFNIKLNKVAKTAQKTPPNSQESEEFQRIKRLNRFKHLDKMTNDEKTVQVLLMDLDEKLELLNAILMDSRLTTTNLDVAKQIIDLVKEDIKQ